tara:strand:- start:1780 stop:2163 length:384 start_codon:yes stop_codon:yes gene_type:complete
MKYDENKVDLSLLPVEALEAIAKVFEFGAKKYGAFNWRADGENTEWRRSFSSLQRHLYAWSECEDTDPDSGLDHLSHAASQLMIMICHAKNHPEMDNRYKGDKNENRGNSKRTKTKIHTKDIYYSQQ